MSFNQFRTNPGQAVSNFKGRTETPRAWPGTAVSTWTNGGLFGSASKPQWELLSSFNPTSSASGFELDMSAYKTDYAAIKVAWHARSTTATTATYTDVSCQRLGSVATGSPKRYCKGGGIYAGSSTLLSDTGNQNMGKIVNYSSQYNFIQYGEYEWWGLESSTIQNSYGTNSMFAMAWAGNNSKPHGPYAANNTQEGNWDRFRVFLSGYSSENTSSRFDGSKSRFMVWGLKAQREALT